MVFQSKLMQQDSIGEKRIPLLLLLIIVPLKKIPTFSIEIKPEKNSTIRSSQIHKFWTLKKYVPIFDKILQCVLQGDPNFAEILRQSKGCHPFRLKKRSSKTGEEVKLKPLTSSVHCFLDFPGDFASAPQKQSST